MKKIAGWMAAPAAVLWSLAVHAQEAQAPGVVEAPLVSPIWAAVFVALVVGLIAWFAISVVRGEKARKAEEKSV